MGDKAYLPDQHHIEKIRKSLWCGREYGNVSIMVGAGFSLNAEKLSKNSGGFLVWNQLRDKMKEELYPYTNSDNQDVLKLASEYEEVFGRLALEEFILSSLPDENYIPGKLHKLLLSLPWGDIYTTNYDTLLERTTKYIYDRKYDLVLNVADIPKRMKPRIIKLHGSFPSHRPFIFSEEDYRTYPKKYAPFVNMVQQTIMENILCLVGFSGDDPNFLNWIGWVRDNLGKNTPPIYFCGFVSSTQRRMLEARGIIPIDFTPLFPDYAYPGTLKHEKALEWFFLNLKYGKRPNVLKWPNLEEITYGNHEDLPYIPVEKFGIRDTDIAFIFPQDVKKEDLLEMLKTWKRIRLLHPGWIITPKDKREGIWIRTNRSVWSILNNIHKLNIVDALMLLYELNWRIEVSLMPLYSEWIDKIVPIIDELSGVFQKRAAYQERMQEFKSDIFSNIDWGYLQSCWVELIFAFMREARGEHNLKLFDKWQEMIKDFIKSSPDWTSRWHYEKALFNLFKLDQEGIRKVLREWPDNKDFPFWKVKRAAILSELNEREEAKNECEEALEDIRIRLQANQNDISLLSQEGWTMYLLKIIKDSQLSEDESREYRNRWTKLERYNCNPFQEIKVMTLLLKDSVPRWDKMNRVTRGFDPGIVTHHFSFGNTNREEIDLAFSFLRLFEEGAIPKRCGIMTVFSKSVINATKWIEPFSPLLAMSALIRTADTKEIKNAFTRETIITLKQEQVDLFYKLFVPSLEQALRNLSNNQGEINFSRIHIQNIIEIISRLYFRFSDEQKDKLFNLMIKMYYSKEIHKFQATESQLDVMFKRVLYDMTNEEKHQKLGILLELPLPGEEGFSLDENSKWFEPFEFIEWNGKYKVTAPDVSWKKDINRLIDLVREAKIVTRDKAIQRLSELHTINGLTEEQCWEFADALYSCRNTDTGLPIANNYYNSVFLNWPIVEGVHIKELYYKWIIKQPIPSIFTINGGYSSGKEFTVFIMEWMNSSQTLYLNAESDYKINYSEEDCMKLLNDILIWWEKEKGNFIDRDFSFSHIEPKLHLYNLICLMIKVIFPKITSINNDVKTKIKQLLGEFKRINITVSHLLPALLNLDIYTEEYIHQILKKDIESTVKNKVKYSSYGCFQWVIYGEMGIISQIPVDLFDNWIRKIYCRKQPGLDSLLEHITNCVLNFEQIFKELHWDWLLDGLEYLLDETDVSVLEHGREFALFPREEFGHYKQLSVRLAGAVYGVPPAFRKKTTLRKFGD